VPLLAVVKLGTSYIARGP